LRGHSAAAQDVIEFAVPHTLAFTFFPAWVSSLREKFGPIKSRLIALNVHDAVMRLVEGGCDIFIGYHHASQPFQLDADRYQMVTLGEETLAPYCKPDANGEPMFRLPGRAGLRTERATIRLALATHQPDRAGDVETSDDGGDEIPGHFRSVDFKG